MPSQKKAAKKVEDVTLTTEPVVETTTDKKPTKRTNKKTTTTTEPVETTTVVTENVVVSKTTNEDPLVSITENFTEFMAKFQGVLSNLTTLRTEFRALEKKALREIKLAQKVTAKKKRKIGNRSPSGFVKPTLISAELAKFLGKPDGTEMARTEVTREINGYIRQHSLQDKSNGRKINPDKNLATLLKIKSGEELTYFNLQRYMSPHFAKAGSTLVGTSQSVATTSI
jgi:upstream activation factor subunit UAF30